jgi:hypothetical protein
MIDLVFLSDQQFVDEFKDLKDGVEHVLGRWYFWDETWSGVCGPYDTEDKTRETLEIYARNL